MTNLTDRMRTCAAAIVASDAHARDDGTGLILRDAADLLIEASNIIEAACEPYRLGPLPVAPRLRPPRACPKCDSRAQKTVRRKGNMLMLICPVCATEWQYQP